jgi:hypothetical protein
MDAVFEVGCFSCDGVGFPCGIETEYSFARRQPSALSHHLIARSGLQLHKTEHPPAFGGCSVFLAYLN